MSYTVRLLDLHDPRVTGEAVDVLRTVFSPATSAADLLSTTVSADPDRQSLYFAAIEDGQIIGFNAFIATRMRQGRAVATAYQSCWSATHPAHQGKKVFATIMNAARDHLAGNALSIFGLPNPNSYPIFVKKLGYQESPGMSAMIPTWGPLLRASLRQAAPPSYFAADEQCILKSKASSASFETSNVEHSFAWGKSVASQWKRLPVKTMLVGGLDLREEKSLVPLLSQISRRCHFAQVIMPASHELARAFPGLRPWSGTKPFIYLPLEGDQSAPLNIMYGAIDVF